ncbi:MAG: hypothetical protein DHS20C15_24050 [Planctomycetota bacterium]|nr:MAG: hypothetical protein DHS20C15_24050 [Planctomycetota bacterium]
MSSDARSGQLGRMLGVALLSAAVLLLQLVQTRIFSMMLWYHLTYLVVTFTMLGFAAGGAILACRPSWRTGNVGSRLSLFALLFSVSVTGAYMMVTRVAAEAGAEQHSTEGILGAALDYAVLVLPMLFAGLAIALTLADAGQKVGRMYGVNMAGSALGCLVYIPVLRGFGGEGAVMFCAALGALGALLYALGSAGARRLVFPAGLVAAGALIIACFAPQALFEVPVAPYKSMAHLLRENPHLEIELTRWDPLCRLDVVGDPEKPGESKRIFQDGDAATELVMGAAEKNTSILSKEGLAYLLFNGKKAPKVLAIGIGGGIDILQAAAEKRLPFLPEGERVDFTGVEINHTTAGLMRNEFADVTNDRYHLPGVEVHVDEGRSWLRRSDERFDIIQMTGTDTYAALSSGSYVMAESYLYTVEAYDDFLDHLSDDGVISVLRFRFEPPRESLRLCAIAVEALRKRGVENPENHVVLLAIGAPGEGGANNVPNEISPDAARQDRTQGFGYAQMLVSAKPFSPEQVNIYKRYTDKDARFRVLHAPYLEGEGPARDYFAAVSAGTDAAFRDAYVYNLDPVTNDSPFFFRYHRWRNLWGTLFGDGEQEQSGTYASLVGAKPIGLMVLGTVLLESTGLVLLLVLLPLLLFRREGLKVQGALRWVLYFGGLGAGYMLVEIVVMQRFVLYLGHPGYAMAVVLMTFLLGSGAGATFAGRSTDPARTLRRALVGVLLLLGLLWFFLPNFFEATLAASMPVRVALTLVLLAPLAFVMGMPFPSGLALLDRRAAPLVPWAFGVNGGASVVASVGAILIALGAGFSTTFGVAAACYALAFLAGRRATA